MRDSALKRTLVRAYFNARELQYAVAGMMRSPAYGEPIADYDAYWRRRAPGGLQPRFEIIARGIADGASVLDVGCGDGVMLEFLASTRRTRGLGIDVSEEAIRRAAARGVPARVQTLGDLRRTAEMFD